MSNVETAQRPGIKPTVGMRVHCCPPGCDFLTGEVVEVSSAGAWVKVIDSDSAGDDSLAPGAVVGVPWSMPIYATLAEGA